MVGGEGMYLAAWGRRTMLAVYGGSSLELVSVLRFFCLAELLEGGFGCGWKRLWVVVDESTMSRVIVAVEKFDLECECQGARV